MMVFKYQGHEGGGRQDGETLMKRQDPWKLKSNKSR